MTISDCIIYYGDDHDFYDKLKDYLSSVGVPGNVLYQDVYSKGKLIRDGLEKEPSIIILDFASVESVRLIADELLGLKRLTQLKKILCVGMFPNKKSLEELGYFFSLGLHLSIIKGSDETNLFSAVTSVGLGIRDKSERFALAKEIDLPLVIGLCSAITRKEDLGFVLETDFPLDQQNLVIRQKLISNHPILTCKVKQKLPSCEYTYLEAAVMNWPVQGPWDQETEGKLSAEEITHWKILMQERLVEPSYPMTLISTDKKIIFDLLEKTMGEKIRLDVYPELIPEMVESVRRLQSRIIFWENGPSASELKRYGSLFSSHGEHTPIIVIFSTQLNTLDVQNLFGYSNVVCSPGKVETEAVYRMMAKYRNRNSVPFSNYNLPIDHQMESFVLVEAQILSLSEQEISFACPQELPMYSVIHLDLPFSMYATLIPNPDGRTRVSKGLCYTGILHGLSEEEFSMLRKFINQIIYKPLKEFSREEIQSVLERKPAALDQKEKKATPIISDERIITGTSFSSWNRRPLVKGKSKL